MRHSRLLSGAMVGITLLSMPMAFASGATDKKDDKTKNASQKNLTYVRPTDPALYVGADTLQGLPRRYLQRF